MNGALVQQDHDLPNEVGRNLQVGLFCNQSITLYEEESYGERKLGYYSCGSKLSLCIISICKFVPH